MDVGWQQGVGWQQRYDLTYTKGLKGHLGPSKLSVSLSPYFLQGSGQSVMAMMVDLENLHPNPGPAAS